VRLSVGLSLALILLANAACRNLDVVTASYATLDEARRAGAIERGWVPDGLPPGTHEIREAHDLDSSRRWGLFSFPPSQADDLRRILSSDEMSLEGARIDIPGRIEWWPVLLRGGMKWDQVRATGLKAYRSRAGDLLFLVNWQQGRAYYWGS
jgi:hypothetical protein